MNYNLKPLHLTLIALIWLNSINQQPLYMYRIAYSGQRIPVQATQLTDTYLTNCVSELWAVALFYFWSHSLGHVEIVFVLKKDLLSCVFRKRSLFAFIICDGQFVNFVSWFNFLFYSSSRRHIPRLFSLFSIFPLFKVDWEVIGWETWGSCEWKLLPPP